MVFCPKPRPSLLPISGSTRHAQYTARGFSGSSCMLTGASTAGVGVRSGRPAGAAGTSQWTLSGTKALPEINNFLQERQSTALCRLCSDRSVSFVAGASLRGRFARTVERLRADGGTTYLLGVSPVATAAEKSFTALCLRCFNEYQGRVREAGLPSEAIED